MTQNQVNFEEQDDTCRPAFSRFLDDADTQELLGKLRRIYLESRGVTLDSHGDGGFDEGVLRYLVSLSPAQRIESMFEFLQVIKRAAHAPKWRLIK